MGLLARLFGPRVRQITVQEADALLRSPEPPLLVDVREAVETRSGTVPGATLIPLTQFGRRFRELPRQRTILTICRSSHRSPIAARRLARAGYQVLDVKGGMLAWEAAGLPTQKGGSGRQEGSGDR